jgi:hypothetical protein
MSAKAHLAQQRIPYIPNPGSIKAENDFFISNQ